MPPGSKTLELPAGGILLVEPDEALLENFAATLSSAKMTTSSFRTLQYAASAAASTNHKLAPAALLISFDERSLQRGSKQQTQLTALRKKWPKSSFIVLADGAPVDWLHSMSVDDLLPKTVPLRTLKSRCQQAIARFQYRLTSQKTIGNSSNIGGFTWLQPQRAEGLLVTNRETLRPTLSEFAVLELLLARSNKPVSYAELAAALGYAADPISLITLIQSASSRLGIATATAIELQHHYHYGYQLNTQPSSRQPER